MKRFLKVVLPCILLAAAAPKLSSIIMAHGDVFDTQNLLQVDAADLKTTDVSPHLEAPIKGEANVVWCGTFQLSWNELCSLLGEDLHFAGQEPEMVAILNKKAFLKDDLDDASYVALADFVRNDVHGRISRELLRKFGGRASPRFLPSPADTPRPQDIVAYSYLFKNLEFAVPFERIDEPLAFGKNRVRCFGIGDVFNPGQTAMYGQVQVLDYQNPDDFIVELRTKSERDRLILANVRPGKTLLETIAATQDRMSARSRRPPRRETSSRCRSSTSTSPATTESCSGQDWRLRIRPWRKTCGFWQPCRIPASRWMRRG